VQPDDAVVLDQRVVGGGVGDPAAREADDDDPALEGDALAALVERVAADRVVDDVGAPPAGDVLDDGHEVVGQVVDDDVGAEVAADLHLLRPALPWRSRAPGRPAQLDRRAPDAAAPACTRSVSPSRSCARRCRPT
jgi:hypothetical protein